MREREGTRITSKRLMITRLRNTQMGRGQYLYRMDRSGKQRLKAQTKKENIGTLGQGYSLVNGKQYKRTMNDGQKID